MQLLAPKFHFIVNQKRPAWTVVDSDGSGYQPIQPRIDTYD